MRQEVAELRRRWHSSNVRLLERWLEGRRGRRQHARQSGSRRRARAPGHVEGGRQGRRHRAARGGRSPCLAGLTPARSGGLREAGDLPEPRLTVTEHQAMISLRARRGQTTAAFPDGGLAGPGPSGQSGGVFSMSAAHPEDRSRRPGRSVRGERLARTAGRLGRRAEELQVGRRGSANSWLELAAPVDERASRRRQRPCCIPPRRSP